jgi:hypothetical protein
MNDPILPRGFVLRVSADSDDGYLRLCAGAFVEPCTLAAESIYAAYVRLAMHCYFQHWAGAVDSRWGDLQPEEAIRFFAAGGMLGRAFGRLRVRHTDMGQA